MSDFVVRIDTAKLNERQAAALSSAIQGAVLAELGKLDLAHMITRTMPIDDINEALRAMKDGEVIRSVLV